MAAVQAEQETAAPVDGQSAKLGSHFAPKTARRLQKWLGSLEQF